MEGYTGERGLTRCVFLDLFSASRTFILLPKSPTFYVTFTLQNLPVNCQQECRGGIDRGVDLPGAFSCLSSARTGLDSLSL